MPEYMQLLGKTRGGELVKFDEHSWWSYRHGYWEITSILEYVHPDGDCFEFYKEITPEEAEVIMAEINSSKEALDDGITRKTP